MEEYHGRGRAEGWCHWTSSLIKGRGGGEEDQTCSDLGLSSFSVRRYLIHTHLRGLLIRNIKVVVDFVDQSNVFQVDLGAERVL